MFLLNFFPYTPGSISLSAKLISLITFPISKFFEVYFLPRSYSSAIEAFSVSLHLLNCWKRRENIIRCLISVSALFFACCFILFALPCYYLFLITDILFQLLKLRPLLFLLLSTSTLGSVQLDQREECISIRNHPRQYLKKKKKSEKY